MKIASRLLCVLVAFTLSQTSFAQDFEVAPVRFDFSAEPGENQTKVITVTNHSNKKTSFIVTIADFLPGGDGKKQMLPPNTTRRSAASWLNINPSFFELNPGEQLPVQVTMLVPGDEYGAAWCMLYLQTAQEQTSWDADKALAAGVMVSGRIGVTVYQSPKSNNNHSIKVMGIQEITESDNVNRIFSTVIDNLGDKITPCKVHLIASNIETAEEKHFPSVEIETYPKSTRNLEIELPSGELPAGKYAIAVIVDYGPKFALEGAQLVIDIE